MTVHAILILEDGTRVFAQVPLLPLLLRYPGDGTVEHFRRLPVLEYCGEAIWEYSFVKRRILPLIR